MTIKVYARSDTARDIAYQNNLLAAIVPGWPDVPTFFDDDRDMLTRSTTRPEKNDIYCASLALFADDADDLVTFLKGIKSQGHKIICAEEELRWNGKQPSIRALVGEWLDARKAGAAMRGARKSAETKKAKTAAALKLIEHELASTNTPSKVLLGKVGIRSIGSIKNYFGFPREELQRRYHAEQKRKARREAYREARAN